jgi:hypothetical protein
MLHLLSLLLNESGVSDLTSLEHTSTGEDERDSPWSGNGELVRPCYERIQDKFGNLELDLIVPVHLLDSS